MTHRKSETLLFAKQVYLAHFKPSSISFELRHISPHATRHIWENILHKEALAAWRPHESLYPPGGNLDVGLRSPGLSHAGRPPGNLSCKVATHYVATKVRRSDSYRQHERRIAYIAYLSAML